MKSVFVKVYNSFDCGQPEWRWKITERDGSTIAVSNRGYLHRIDAVKNLKLMQKIFNFAVYDFGLLAGEKGDLETEVYT